MNIMGAYLESIVSVRWIIILNGIIFNQYDTVDSLNNYNQKTWIQSSSLDKANSWYGGKIPCPGQKIILPENEVVYFPNTLTIGPEIQLPQNGMILFPTRGRFENMYLSNFYYNYSLN